MYLHYNNSDHNVLFIFSMLICSDLVLDLGRHVQVVWCMNEVYTFCHYTLFSPFMATPVQLQSVAVIFFPYFHPFSLSVGHFWCKHGLKFARTLLILFLKSVAVMPTDWSIIWPPLYLKTASAHTAVPMYFVFTINVFSITFIIVLLFWIENTFLMGTSPITS